MDDSNDARDIKTEVKEQLDYLLKEYAMDNARVAKAIKLSPSTVSKASTGKISEGAALNVLNQIKSLRARLDKGESIENKYLYITELVMSLVEKNGSKKRFIWLVIGIVALILVVLIPMLFDLEIGDAGNRFSEDVHYGVILNLLACIISIFLLWNKKIEISSDCNAQVKKSISQFCLAWFGVWISWLLLFAVLITLHEWSPINPYFTVLADIFNLISSLCLFLVFYIMYDAGAILQRQGQTAFILFVLIGIGISINHYFAHEEIVTKTISYGAGVALLFVIGRLDSIHIKVDNKLLMLSGLYLYALMQLDWELLSEWVLIIAMFGKIVIYRYVERALLSKDKLEEYFMYLHEEASKNND